MQSLIRRKWCVDVGCFFRCFMPASKQMLSLWLLGWKPQQISFDLSMQILLFFCLYHNFTHTAQGSEVRGQPCSPLLGLFLRNPTLLSPNVKHAKRWFMQSVATGQNKIWGGVSANPRCRNSCCCSLLSCFDPSTPCFICTFESVKSGANCVYILCTYKFVLMYIICTNTYVQYLSHCANLQNRLESVVIHQLEAADLSPACSRQGRLGRPHGWCNQCPRVSFGAERKQGALAAGNKKHIQLFGSQINDWIASINRSS